MKAIRMHSYGGPEVLVYENAPRPKPDHDVVLVEVHAAGVNPIDWKVREGYAKGWIKHKLPLVPGWDVSGIIAELAEGVKKFAVGDQVYGKLDIALDGAYAEYAVTKTENIALKPKTADYLHAAAVPIAALTAWQSLFDHAGLAAGQTVLIHGAAGGVGHFAVQFAKWKGARVLGTASARNADFLRMLGADMAIDYTTKKFEEEAEKVDCVLDTQGGDVLRRSLQILKKGGIVVSTLAEPSPEELEKYGVRASHMYAESNSAQLSEIAELIDNGKVRIMVEAVFPLEEVRKAHAMSQTGHTRGKIVLKIKE